MSKNGLNWFEIPVKDFDRAMKFYSEILGSELTLWEMGSMKLGIFPSDREGVSGAILYGEGEPSDKGTIVYLNCDGILDEVISRVEKAGGKVIQPKTQVTDDIGYIAIITDTEGNKVGLHSPPR
ncbi:MAG: VOC family protein [Ignavibacteria bacterium]|nr:VOC family protein [Ignavibacteria bacterium]